MLPENPFKGLVVSFPDFLAYMVVSLKSPGIKLDLKEMSMHVYAMAARSNNSVFLLSFLP